MNITRPVFERVVDIGRGAFARDEFGNLYDGIESSSEDDKDSLGKCCMCGQDVYIGWRRKGTDFLFCYDCPEYPQGE